MHATDLKRTGWNLISVCQEMIVTSIDMTNIEELQSQDGETLYTGEFTAYSNLTQLEAGYAYWVKGDVNATFNSGIVKGALVKPLKRTGWNLMASCEEVSKDDINMTNIEEIQAQDGASLYTAEFASSSNLERLENGYGYWVKGEEGVLFTSVNMKKAPYDLEKFKSVLSQSNLQWQSKDGAYDIKSDLEGVSTSYFYVTDNQYMTFNIANSGQKRVELRQKETWLSTTDVEFLEKVKCHTPIALREYTFTQLFNKTKNSPSLRLLWHADRSGKSKHLWAFLKTDAGEIKTDLGINPDDFFEVKISIVNSNLSIQIKNKLK
jgi:hypothetical protein